MKASDIQTMQKRRLAGFATLTVYVRRVKKVLRLHRYTPPWAHVPNRVWRRNSALLTYMHEAQTGNR